MASKDIATELKLSPGTIDNYISETLKFLKHKIRKEDMMLVLFATLFLF
jgi:DNA-binding NarL/FixJ family response regulator